MNAGIYKLSITDSHQYWGSAEDTNVRKGKHVASLHRGDHHNTRLQRAFNKYGEAALEFEVVESVCVDELLDVEQTYIDKHWGEDYCANLSRHASKPHGYIHTNEAKIKISKAHKGRKFTKRHRENLSKAFVGNQNAKGHKQSKEHLAKLSEARQGNTNATTSVEISHPTLGDQTFGSVKEASAFLDVSRHTLQNWLKGKPLPGEGQRLIKRHEHLVGLKVCYATKSPEVVNSGEASLT